MDPHVTLQLGLGGEGLLTAVTWMGSDLHVDLEMMLPGGRVLEGLVALRTGVDLLVTQLEVSSANVSFEVARVIELLLAVVAVEPRYLVVLVVGLHVVPEDAPGDVALAADEALELELLGVELHVIGEGLRRAEYFVTGLTEMLLAAVRL